jgi:eukaryotic-like serine/threonine-protein kinase
MFWVKGQLIHNGKYQIEKYLGGGGFAVTYQAIHTALNRLVVIKTPNQDVQNDPDYPKYIERFRKEAQLLAQCCADSHSNIVQVFDLFEEDGRSCLVMQYIQGENLWQFVQRQGALSETEAVKYICQIGLALLEVHKKGVFHLDVTPPNIMLSSDLADLNSSRAVLIDFGIAGDMSAPSTLSRSFGNKRFAPYEFIRKGIRHPTVDVYCLAASLYYAVTGKCPTNSFDRFDGNRLIPPRELTPNLSHIVNQAVIQGMALKAEDRPQTMQKWLNLLEQRTPSPNPSHLPQSRFVIEPNISLPPRFCFWKWKSDWTEKSSDVEKDPSYTTSIDYSYLENLLKNSQWKQADETTAKLMLEIASNQEEGWPALERINDFSTSGLSTIDQLWINYSSGQFGFSIQKRIWLECGGKFDYTTECCLCDRVGWRKNGRWLYYTEIDFSGNSPPGHLPARVGWFGWDLTRWVYWEGG